MQDKVFTGEQEGIVAFYMEMMRDKSRALVELLFKLPDILRRSIVGYIKRMKQEDEKQNMSNDRFFRLSAVYLLSFVEDMYSLATSKRENNGGEILALLALKDLCHFVVFLNNYS